MEREISSKPRPAGASGVPIGGSDLDAIRDKLGGILDAADKVLDAVPHLTAEEYLQQSRQRGAQ